MGLQKNGKTKQTQRRMSAAQKRKFIALAGLVLLCAVFIIGIFYSSVYRYVHKMEKTQIEQNIYVQGMNVSGLTKEQALKKLEDRWLVMKNTPIILKAGDKMTQVTLSELGILQGDTEKLVDEAADYGKKGDLLQRYRKIRQAKKEKVEYKDDYQVEEDQAAEVLEEKTADFFEEAVDAQITRVGGVFQITDERDGEKADVEKAVEEITERLEDMENGKSIEIEVDSEKEKAQICKKDLEKIQDELGTAEIELKETGKKQEVILLAGILNGQIIMPEKECSLQKILGEYLDSGFSQEALDMVASVVYDAALYAEMEIYERHEAEAMPDYVEAGMEAALDGKKDLKIENNTKAPLYIEAYIDGDGKLVCAIYGEETRDDERSISFERESKEEKQNVVYKEDDSLGAGKMKTEESGSPEYTVTLRKIVKEDGEETEEDIDTSEYKSVDSIVHVGIKTEDETIRESLREAIATQDKEKIEQAVSRAKK